MKKHFRASSRRLLQELKIFPKPLAGFSSVKGERGIGCHKNMISAKSNRKIKGAI
jgi:hypothetical protein